MFNLSFLWGVDSIGMWPHQSWGCIIMNNTQHHSTAKNAVGTAYCVMDGVMDATVFS